MAIRTPRGDLLATRTASVSSTIDFDGELDSSYSEFLLIAKDVYLNSAGNLLLRLGVSGGTYRTSGYIFRCWRIAGSHDVSTSGSSTSISLTHDSVVAATSDNPAAFEVRIHNAKDAAIDTSVFCDYFAVQASAGDRGVSGGSYPTAEAHDSVQILPSTSTITGGVFELYGIR